MGSQEVLEAWVGVKTRKPWVNFQEGEHRGAFLTGPSLTSQMLPWIFPRPVEAHPNDRRDVYDTTTDLINARRSTPFA